MASFCLALPDVLDDEDVVGDAAVADTAPVLLQLPAAAAQLEKLKDHFTNHRITKDTLVICQSVKTNRFEITKKKNKCFLCIDICVGI